MRVTRGLPDPERKRHGDSLVSPAVGVITIGATILTPGLLLLILGHSWVFALGIALVAISFPVGTVGLAGFGASLVARWAARRKSFAWPRY